MRHKIRKAISDREQGGQLKGLVAVEEGSFGGREKGLERNQHHHPQGFSRNAGASSISMNSEAKPSKPLESTTLKSSNTGAALALRWRLGA